MAYSRPSRFAPRWRVGYLVFQSGAPNLPAMSRTGGGQIYLGGRMSGSFVPVASAYETPKQSVTGAGEIVARPGFLTMLLQKAKAAV